MIDGEKIRITQDQVVARKGDWVTYADAGGTLRKAKKSQVDIVGQVDSPGQAGQAAGAPPVDEATTPAELPTTSAPPASDTAPATTDSAAPKDAAPAQSSKVKRERKMATATQVSAKKKAPVKVAKKAAKTEASGVRTIAGKAVNLSEYTKVKAPGGGTSYHNGDAVAEKLAGKTLDEVYAQASKVLKVEEKELRKKYGHLNLGMQRMSLGNRMRKVLITKH